MAARVKEPRFTPISIGKEVERGRARCKVSVEMITERLGKLTGMKWTRTYWYKKIAGKPAFDIEELGWLAAEFMAPKGWPIVPWDEGRSWELHLEEG